MDMTVRLGEEGLVRGTLAGKMCAFATSRTLIFLMGDSSDLTDWGVGLQGISCLHMFSLSFAICNGFFDIILSLFRKLLQVVPLGRLKF